MSEFTNPLISPEDLLTQGGATLAVTVVTNGLEYLFYWNPKYIGFIVSFIVVFGATGSSILTDFSLVKVIIGIINTFFVYSGAVGITSITSPYNENSEKPKSSEKTSSNIEEIGRSGKRVFWKPWF